MEKTSIKYEAKELNDHQLPSVLLSSENNNDYERVCPAKATVCSCYCPCCSTLSSSNWASLPRDLLELILDKLVFVSDYIRFTSVCKPWNSVAMNHKEKRIKLSHHELPWLLVCPDKNSKEWHLYNFVTKEFHNFKLRTVLPYIVENESCYGSCYGWLFFMKKSSLIVVNPLSNTVINLPPFTKFTSEYYNPTSVKLSRDPSLGSFEVLVTSEDDDSPTVAHLKYGDEFWTYSSIDEGEKHVLIATTFYKNYKLGMTLFRSIVFLDVISGECIKINFQILSPWYDREGFQSFVEDTNGDLLLVCGLFEYVYAYEDDLSLETYEITKLQIDSNGRFECIPVENLGDNSLFLGLNCGISVLASNYPKCIPNTIYSGFFCSEFDNMTVIDVCDLEDGYIKQSRLPKGFRKAGHPLSEGLTSTWLVPSLKL